MLLRGLPNNNMEMVWNVMVVAQFAGKQEDNAGCGI